MSRVSTTWRVVVILATAALLLSTITVGSVVAKPPADRGQPERVATASDAGKEKLHPRLRDKVEAGETESILVFATVSGDPTAATRYLVDAQVASSDGAALLLGSIPVQQLPKLATAQGVVAVGPIDFTQTGQPLGVPDPELNSRPSTDVLNQVLKSLYKKEVPYSEAPPLAGSNFDELKDLALLDAGTHNFAQAWDEGYTGEGVTVGVMDGGTDFGHPDLIGTWQTWSGQTGARAGWNGWPKAFDPFGTLQWLATSHVQQGLSWYVETAPATCKDWADKAPQATCAVKFSTRTGPSRNFGVPSGFNQHTYRFPAGASMSGDVMLGSHPDDYLLALFGERPAFLVADSTTAGVYDTVYVDLDNDYRFDDEKPVTKASPASYRDMDGDGYTDLSGGLLYYISDGVTAVPGGLDAFLGPTTFGYGAGELVAWTGDYDPAIGGHGTLTASNVVGQGVINAKAPTFADVPGGTYPGAVIGGAPNAKLAPYGDIYFSIDFSSQFGYFLATRRGVDITSNSYGYSDTDNDGWDAASQEADVIHNGRGTTPLFSTGNGAPGFGTVAPPSPIAGIAVGASTQFGGTGWDSIANASQIVDNDVMVWSNRGFGANGTTGVDVVADGAFSAGDVTLNAILNGQVAWETWGGTSRSTPVAAGAAALVYQSWRQANGTSIVPGGFYTTVKDVLKSSAQDLGYNATIQGAGSVDAAGAVEAAAGTAARVSPNEWRVGDYRGTEYSVFTNIIHPGESDTQSFAISGGSGPWTISDRQMVRTDVETLSFSSANRAQESNSNFNAPDYLMDLSDRVSDHPDADLMVIRLNYPREQFDGNVNYDEDQAWRLLTYNWTDVNGDGNLWTDGNGNGVVNHSDLASSSNIDGFADLNFAASEMDQGEYVRFMYHRAGSNALMSFVRNPAERMADGIYLGLQHTARSAMHPVTDFDVEISWYENVDWSWVLTTPTGGGFDATINVPADAPYGMYEGAIVADNGDETLVVPVSVAVAATAELDEDGNISGAIELGGSEVASAQENLLYNNGSVFGANDWTWRAESGDWRFFFVDVPDEPADGNLFLARTTWDGTAPYTDIDTLIMGPSENHFEVFGDSVFGAPYILDTVGGSPNTHIGSGVWIFNTATGANEDFVTAPVQEGLHNIALHQVSWQGDAFTTPFQVTLGGASVAPSSVDLSTNADSGSFELTFASSLDLDGLTAEGFGLSQPIVEAVAGQQDNPNDPSSASIKRDITIDHASRLTVSTALGSDDFDLFVVYDENGDGVFANSEIVGSSTTGTSNEFVELTRPGDGDYQVWVQGWSVAGNPILDLTIDAVQGNDLTVSGLPAGAVPAGTSVVLTVDFSKAMTVGETYFGELQLGPPSAPTALSVPIAITRIE